MARRNLPNVEEMNPWDSMCLGVGYYVVSFSHMEFVLALVFARILGISEKQIRFMWRDIGIKQKLTTIRRAANETYGEAGWRELRDILNRADHLLPFRNDLMHGVYWGGQGGPAINREGTKLRQVDASSKAISYRQIMQSVVEIQSVREALNNWVFAKPSRTSK